VSRVEIRSPASHVINRKLIIPMHNNMYVCILYIVKSQSTVVFIIIAVINKKEKTAARKTFSDVPFIGKVVAKRRAV